MRSAALTTVALALAILTLYCLGSAFRDNDQAALVSGALQLNRGQMSPFHAMFYNYDKQWGSYLLLAGIGLLTPYMDPVLRGNLLQIALLLSAAWLCLAVFFRWKRAPLWSFLPIVLCPALVLYLPFLATASLSLAFLFLAFFLSRCAGRFGRLPGVPIAIACAAACRGDVVLAVPAIVLSMLPRSSLRSLLKSRLAWSACLAAVLPLLLGISMAARKGDTLAGFSFNAELFAGFVTFGFGLGAAALLGAVVVSRVRLIASRPPWRGFYAAELLALLIPVGFYWAQLYSTRYFFLTLAALLFQATSRRGVETLRRAPRTVSLAVLTLTIAPWLIGLSLPSLRSFRPTLFEPSTFPTADGLFPMGAFLPFAVHAAGRDRFLIDHNQKIWESAKTVDFRSCNGAVPLLATPMSNYLDLVIRLQNKTTSRLTNLNTSPCGGAYLDLRSVIRRDAKEVFVERSNLTIVSARPELGRPIVWMSCNRDPSAETETYQELAAYYHGKDAEVFVGRGLREDVPPSGLTDLRFSFGGTCERKAGSSHLCVSGPGISGWARTVFPEYIDK